MQDQAARGLPALRDAAGQVTAAAAREPGLTAVFSQFEVSTPQLYVDIDRDRAQALGVPPSRVFEALEVFLGSSFVNDFNYPRPHLPGDRAGRLAVQTHGAEYLRAPHPQRHRRHGAARIGGHVS